MTKKYICALALSALMTLDAFILSAYTTCFILINVFKEYTFSSWATTFIFVFFMGSYSKIIQKIVDKFCPCTLAYIRKG